MLTVTTEAEVESALRSDPEVIVGVEPHPDFPDALVFQPADRQAFYDSYGDWVSRHLVLNELFALQPFTDRLRADGLTPVFMPSCEPVLAAHTRWSEPLDVHGFTCPGGGDLYPFQTFGLRHALERAEAQSAAERMFFVNWSAGAGKSLFACAGAQELVNRDMVDIVIAVTNAPLKTNLLRFFEGTTQLEASMVEGTATKRREQYSFPRQQVYVLNYDRFRVDAGSLAEMTQDARVLFIFDECQKILTDQRRTLARKAIDSILALCDPTIWAMSASVVRASPLRYRDVFSLSGGTTWGNPLGTKAAFERRYIARRKTFFVPTNYGGQFPVEKIEWNLPALHDVRHRVADCTHAIRKTDPEIRSTFKGLTSVVMPVQLSPQDGRLYDMVLQRAERAQRNDEGGLAGYALMLRHICNNPIALTRTDVEFAQEVMSAHPRLINSTHCNKVEMLVSQLESIRDAGDKVLVFSQWVYTSLYLIADELNRRQISYVIHHGGQSAAVAQEAQDTFKADPDVVVFLSSDAGAFGLNLPQARYVISYEPTFSWDTLMQRSERINRADSWLDGMTSYTMVTEGTIEERIAQVCEDRRRLASATLGTTETLETGDEPSNQWLIFG